VAVWQRAYWLLALAVLWVTLTESFTLGSLVGGLLVAALVVALFPVPAVALGAARVRDLRDLPVWLWRMARLLLYFLWELLKANWHVARLAIARRPALKPGILAMELRVRSPLQVALLATLITLPPGTATVEVSPDCRVMYIHCIDASDPEAALAVARRFEEQVLEVLD